MTTQAEPKKRKISKESAKAQINSWLDFYGLDFSDIETDQGEAAAQTFVNTLVRAIMRAELEINVDGTATVTQHLVHPVGNIKDISYVGQKITLSRIAMEKGGGDDQTRTMQFMATMSGVEIKDLTALDGADLTVMRRVSTIFGMV
jgi:hypothetical protein